ncbi:hypothetical protein [Cysteiniphilum halobium]|uniref:hypothetical protein n=1 Tax=Cysteiniphilum halobium TaxID=2219059 RepID=UPI000E65D0CC|nr:hypothetical protein [Cysteiniphilum halobium]
MKKAKDKKAKVRFRRTKRMFLVDAFHTQHRFIGNLFKSILKLKKTECEMTYEDLIKSGIDDTRMVYIIKKFTLLLRLCLLVAVAIYFYALYLFIQGYILVGLIALSLIMLMLANAFKYHFWRYQLYRKKLGCTFHEWFSDLFKGEK